MVIVNGGSFSSVVGLAGANRLKTDFLAVAAILVTATLGVLGVDNL